MDANARTINDILNTRRKLDIPYYQRSYVWGEKQWKRFLEDMENASLKDTKPYFIGSIILKQKPVPTNPEIGDVRTVIDGQQRLSTMTIFFKVLSLMKGKPSIFDTFLISLNEDTDDDNEVKVVALDHNHIDKPWFDKIVDLETLEDIGVDGDGKELPNLNQIVKLYRYLKANITDPSKFVANRIKDKVLFVAIDLTYEENEQQIFDTINSLGVTLTTSELLKNYFFDRNNKTEYDKYWFPVFEKDDTQKAYWDKEVISGSTKTHLNDMFFTAYLTIKTHEAKYKVSAEDKLKYARVADMFDSYKEFIHKYADDDKEGIMKEVNEYAKIFMNHFNPDCKEEAVSSIPGMERMNLIMFAHEVSVMVPYILFVHINVKDETEKNKIFAYLESYIMRRVICHSDTRGYYKLFYDSLLTNNVLDVNTLQDFINNKDDSRVIASPTDEEVWNCLQKKVLVNKQNTAILYMLESRLRANGSHATALLGYKYYSLEHMMPKKWQLTWDTSLPQETIDKRNEMLWTFGNLAIIPGKLNTSISNATWDVKLNGKGNRYGLTQNASGLLTLQPYLMKSIWDENEIQNRAKDLYDKIIEVWKR